MSNILLLEDDLSLINGLSFALKKQGFELAVARTLKEADSLWIDGKYDLLILDVSLPDGTGFEFCKKVRQVSKVPIIFLTAADEEVDIIMGLDIGGDDYITKPFKLGVLVSRVNALLRRAKDFSSTDTWLESNGMKVLLLQGQAFKNGELLDLTAAEYKLLCLFMRNPNMVLTKAQILDKLWDCDGNYIDSSVSARIKQYGAMRAVGMESRQVTKMIAAEAITYAASGAIVGIVLGLMLHHLIYVKIIISHFGGTWKIPATSIAMIVLLISVSCILAVHAPAKRIRNMPITATINEL